MCSGTCQTHFPATLQVLASWTPGWLLGLVNYTPRWLHEGQAGWKSGGQNKKKLGSAQGFRILLQEENRVGSDGANSNFSNMLERIVPKQTMIW